MSAGPGIYVHFPYCDRRCPYCDFVLTTPRRVPSEAFTDAILREWAWRAPRELTASPRTLYLGGGTPSLWEPAQLGRLVSAIEATSPRPDFAERTIEANPEQLTEVWLEAILALGFGRVSLGVQSLSPAGLSLLGRSHGRSGAEAALDRLAEAHGRGRLSSYSVDLIYGWQGQDEAAWVAELDEVVRRWSPPHLSCYALTVEPRTVLGKQVREGQAAPPDDAQQVAMMFAARARLAEAGYAHYEVSSWARPGHHAVHNASYWEMTPYLGLGAGAAGFTGARRYRNQPVVRRYLASDGGAFEAESQVLGEAELLFEQVMTGLRRLDLGLVWTAPLETVFGAVAAEAVGDGRLSWCVGPGGDRALRLTDAGLPFMDDVLLAFLNAAEPGRS